MPISNPPVYRYITADFLTGTILSELSLIDVNYGRSLKSAGSVTGTIAVLPSTDLTQLYNNTVPGKTALYILRNNKCVWGGLIWSRQYDLFARTVSINGSEFQSYFSKRLIWKDYGFSFSGTVERDYTNKHGYKGKAKITIADNPENHLFTPGSSFQISYGDPFSQWGSLRNYVAANPEPSNITYIAPTTTVSGSTSVSTDITVPPTADVTVDSGVVDNTQNAPTKDANSASIIKNTITNVHYQYSLNQSMEYQNLTITNASYNSGVITYTYSIPTTGGYSDPTPNSFVTITGVKSSANTSGTANVGFNVRHEKIATVDAGAKTFTVNKTITSQTHNSSTGRADCLFPKPRVYAGVFHTLNATGYKAGDTISITGLDRWYSGLNTVGYVNSSGTAFESTNLTSFPALNISSIDVSGSGIITLHTKQDHHFPNTHGTTIMISGASGHAKASDGTSITLSDLNGEFIVDSTPGVKLLHLTEKITSFTKGKTYKIVSGTAGNLGNISLNHTIAPCYISTVTVSGKTHTFTSSGVNGYKKNQVVNLRFTVSGHTPVNTVATITAVDSVAKTFTVSMSKGLGNGTYVLIGYSLATVQIMPLHTVNVSFDSVSSTNAPNQSSSSNGNGTSSGAPIDNTVDITSPVIAGSTFPTSSDMLSPGTETTSSVFYVQSQYKILKYKTKKSGSIILTLDDPNHLLDVNSQIFITGLSGTHDSVINANGGSTSNDVKSLGYTVTTAVKDNLRSTITIDYGQESQNFTDYTSSAQTNAYIEVFPNTIASSKYKGTSTNDTGVAIIAQTNAYEYVRYLLKEVFQDFQNYKFDNAQLEPGVTMADINVQSYLVQPSTFSDYYQVTLTTDKSISTTSSGITNATADGTTVTYTVGNNFLAGQVISIDGVKSNSNPNAVKQLGFNLQNVVVATANSTQFTVTNDLYATETYISSSGSAYTVTQRHQYIPSQRISVFNVGIDEDNTISGSYSIKSVEDTDTLNTVTFDVPKKTKNKITDFQNFSDATISTITESGSFSQDLSMSSATPDGKNIYFNSSKGKTYCTLRFTGTNKTIVDSQFNLTDSSGKVKKCYITIKNVDAPDSAYILYDNPKALVVKVDKQNAYTDITYQSVAKSLTNSTAPDGYTNETQSNKYSQALYGGVNSNNATYQNLAEIFLSLDYESKGKNIYHPGDKITITSDSKTNKFYATYSNTQATIVEVKSKKDLLKKSTKGTVLVISYDDDRYVQNKKVQHRKSSQMATFYSGTVVSSAKSVSSYADQVFGYQPTVFKNHTIGTKSWGEFPKNANMGGISLSIENKISDFSWDSTTGFAVVTTDTPHGFYNDSIVNNVSSLKVDVLDAFTRLVTIYTSERNAISIGDTVQISFDNSTYNTNYGGSYIVAQVSSPQAAVGNWSFSYYLSGNTPASPSSKTATTGVVSSNKASVVISIHATYSDSAVVRAEKEFLNGRWLLHGQLSNPRQFQILHPVGTGAKFTTGLDDNKIIVLGAHVSSKGYTRYFVENKHDFKIGNKVTISGIVDTGMTSLNVSNMEIINSGLDQNLGSYFDITYSPSGLATETYYPSGFDENNDINTVYFTNTGLVQHGSISTFNLTDSNTIDRDVYFDSGISISNDLIRSGDFTTVGDHLDTYSNFIGGFEYRVDCDYNSETNKFENKFVFVPNNFHDPMPWTVSDPKRFKADRIQFEYPGSISSITINENAETATTRYFAAADGATGDATTAPFSSAASSIDLLADNWPLLEQAQKVTWPLLADVFTGKAVNNVDNWGNSNPEIDLYKTARRYLTQSRPPMGDFNVTVNGGFEPQVGSYAPGDWCQLNINNEFFQQRLNSGLEPRNTTFVRKIDGYTVQVPNYPSQPEIVTLTLVTDWMVDRFQAQIDADYEKVTGVYN